MTAEPEEMKKVEAEFYKKHPVPPWRVVKFDAGKYVGGHVPIYIAGERQVHIMQPYDRKKQDAGSAPNSVTDWVDHVLGGDGQVVLGFDALEDFVAALIKFRDEQRKVEAEMKAKLR